MVWKQDLAQLKAQLKPDLEPVGPPAPPPKPTQPPTPHQSMEDADLLFLRAMGGVAVPPSGGSKPPQELAAGPSGEENLNVESKKLSPESSLDDFSQALADLKGLRPLPKAPVLLVTSSPTPPNNPVMRSQAPTIPPEAAIPTPEVPKTPEAPSATANDVGMTSTTSPSPEAARPRSGPALMHLAAGMAIEVDGTLDLRRHSLNDAKERLKERVRDGVALGWRTLLVLLGPNEALKQGFLAFLTTPEALLITRYAQAPIPMGGAQAWVLYLSQPILPETRK